MTERANEKPRVVGFQANEEDRARIARIQERGHFPTKSAAIRHALIVTDNLEEQAA